MAPDMGNTVVAAASDVTEEPERGGASKTTRRRRGNRIASGDGAAGRTVKTWKCVTMGMVA